jgi:hypothetical protein
VGNSFSTVLVAIEANIKSASRPKRMIPNIIGIWQDSPAQVEICPSSNPSGMILYTAFNSLQPAAGGDRVLHTLMIYSLAFYRFHIYVNNTITGIN